MVVRPVGNRYQLIAGERRWRAAQRAGLQKVVVIVRQVPDELALEMTLVENIQREDLNAMEAARAFERLMYEFHLTQEAVAERTGKDRATVANAIRLLKLEPLIQDWIEEGKLSAGHGRALLAVGDSQLRMRYAQRAARGGLTVRQIERLASRRARGTSAPTEVHVDPNIREALEELQRHLGTKILLRSKTKLRPGQLVLEYYDEAQLMGIYDRLMK
ncbi:MAG: chromosome partitioning protein ParB [Proteobacteria bacterium]|nr:MAG: chromosome partitioning protein ParB [Pseudomonadota bacterium]